MRHASGQVGGGRFQCNADSGDAGYILGTGAAAGFLAAAIEEVPGRNALADIQRANALGGIELMAGEREHIHAQLFYIYGDRTNGLHGIGVEPDLMGMRHGSQLFDRLNGADFVVGHHDADERGIGADRRLYIFGVDIAVTVGLDIAYFKADALEHGHAVHNGVMLKSAGDQVLFALGCQLEGSALDGPVISLAAAARKEDLAGVCIQSLCHLSTAGIDQFFGLIADGIVAAGVAAGAVQCLIDGCQCLRAAGGSGSVI